MNDYKWMKMYYDTLENPEIGMLPEHARLRYYEMLLLAAKNSPDGVLPSKEKTAWSLRTTVDDIQTMIETFLDLGILKPNEMGEFYFAEFRERQETNLTDAEKMRRYRSKKAEVTDDSDLEITESNKAVTSVKKMLPQNKNKIKNKKKIKKEILSTFNENEFPKSEIFEIEPLAALQPRNANETPHHDSLEKASPKKEDRPKLSPKQDQFWDTFQENKENAFAFYQSSGISPTNSEFGRWIKDLRVFNKAAINAEQISQAVTQMKNDGLTISSPGSVYKVARSIQAGITPHAKAPRAYEPEKSFEQIAREAGLI